MTFGPDSPRVAAEPFSFDLPDGARASVWDTGVLCLEPASGAGDLPGGRKDIVLSCGIHGNETAPSRSATSC